MFMILNLYSMFDAAASVFMNPVVDTNDAVAMRHFQAACMSSDDMQVKPEDFALYRIGTFDTSTSAITGCPAEVVCRATDFVKKKVK